MFRSPRLFVGLSLPISLKMLVIFGTLGYVGVGYVSKNWQDIKGHYYEAVAQYAPGLLASVVEEE